MDSDAHEVICLIFDLISTQSITTQQSNKAYNKK